MAKNSITDYDNISGNNTDVQSVDISEGCSPSGINNAIREVMADLADVNDGTVALTSPQVGSLTVGDSHTIGNDVDDNLEIASSTAENIVIDSAGGTTVFKENATEVARLTGGALGIGTTSPSTPIEISSASNTALRLMNTATNYWDISNDSNLKFGRGGTEHMRINSSGNVGIGTSSPSTSHKLTLDHTSNYGGISLKQSGTQVGQIIQEGGTGNVYIDADSAGIGGNLILRTNGGSERMRIDTDGRIIHGSTSSAPAYASINVISPINSIALGTNSGSDYYAWAGYRNGTLSGYIYTTTTATSYSTTSDYRLKENVTDMTGATERLKQLNPVRFNFIADADTTVDGFLAHEVQDVVPEAITGAKDAMRDEQYEVTPAVLDDDGNEITPAVMGTRSVPDYQGIDQSKLVPLLVATIQELEARITALEAN